MKERKIFIQWDKSTAPKNVINKLNNCLRLGASNVLVIAPEKAKTYPNVCVPLAGIFEWYKSKGIKFKYYFPGKNYVEHTSLDSPLVVESLFDSADLKYPLDKVWKYSTSEGVDALVTAFISAIRESDILESGILTSTEWCINEVMDNVLQHANADCGYVMGQLHKEKKRISICVFDMGLGIYSTLKGTQFAPRTAVDAITLALQERVTRDARIGQGNGMWGLSEIIKGNQGRVRILSNGARYGYIDGKIYTGSDYKLCVGKYNNATLIDFQIDYSKSIDVAKALNGRRLEDYWLEDRELEDGEICFALKRDSSGTGTRIAAEKFRNVIMNSMIENNKRIVLDFEGVNLVSSSYADELIGKIIAERGLVYFMDHFQLSNLSPTNIGVINRSVEQRMGHVYYGTTVLDED